MRPLNAVTPATEMPITSTMMPSRSGSMIAIAMSAPANSSALPTESARPWVSAA